MLDSVKHHQCLRGAATEWCDVPEDSKHRPVCTFVQGQDGAKAENLWLEEGCQKPTELEKAWNHDVGRPREPVWR